MIKSAFLKRISTVILALVISVGTFLSTTQTTLAHSTLDQYITTADGYFRFLTHPKLGQTFRPTYNKLDGLGVYSGIQPAGPSSCTLTVTLYKNTDMANPVAHESTTIYKMEAYTIIEIPTVDVVPDARYTMYATANSPYAYWLAKMSDAYPRGTAIIDSTADSGVDFVFATFGYNGTPPALPDPAPSVEVTPNPTGGDAADTSSTSSDSSNSTTSNTSTNTTSTPSSIAAPTGLTATAGTDGSAGVINLAWTASKTTDLTGYTIMRSSTEKDGYTEIGATDSKTLTFKDDKVVTDQTYYYIARAYKGGSVSVNSNVASAKITDTSAPAVPANFKIASSNESDIVFSWDKNTEADLANYILTVAENGNADAKVLAEIDTIGKDETTYTLKLADNAGLAKDTEYTFYLQAKDISTNFSEKATVTGKFATEKAKSNLWLWIGLGAAGILIAAGIVFAIILIRRKKKLRSAV